MGRISQFFSMLRGQPKAVRRAESNAESLFATNMTRGDFCKVALVTLLAMPTEVNAELKFGSEEILVDQIFRKERELKITGFGLARENLTNLVVQVRKELKNMGIKDASLKKNKGFFSHALKKALEKQGFAKGGLYITVTESLVQKKLSKRVRNVLELIVKQLVDPQSLNRHMGSWEIKSIYDDHNSALINAVANGKLVWKKSDEDELSKAVSSNDLGVTGSSPWSFDADITPQAPPLNGFDPVPAPMGADLVPKGKKDLDKDDLEEVADDNAAIDEDKHEPDILDEELDKNLLKDEALAEESGANFSEYLKYGLPAAVTGGAVAWTYNRKVKIYTALVERFGNLCDEAVSLKKATGQVDSIEARKARIKLDLRKVSKDLLKFKPKSIRLLRTIIRIAKLSEDEEIIDEATKLYRKHGGNIEDLEKPVAGIF